VPMAEVDRQVRSSARPLAVLCKEAFSHVDTAGAGRLDATQFRRALQQVFAQLSDDVPQPDHAWFTKVFENYASRCGGTANLRCVEDAAQQYHEHHMRKKRAPQEALSEDVNGRSDPLQRAEASYAGELPARQQRIGRAVSGQSPKSASSDLEPQGPLARATSERIGRETHLDLPPAAAARNAARGVVAGYPQQVVTHAEPPSRFLLTAKQQQQQQQQQQQPLKQDVLEQQQWKCYPPETQQVAPGKVQLASVVMFPTSRERMAIFDHYDFETSLLGAGSFGEVSLVKHKITGQKRACKCMGLEDEEDWRLATKEIELLKRLDHPNILRLSESFIDGRNIYLVAELCEGGHLLEGFASRGQKASASSCLRQILGATAYCHGKGIIHRDLKPGNVLYANQAVDSVLKVIDFGLADFLERLRGRWHRAGTLAFMAPEMVTVNGGYTEKVDAWSTGVIAYLLLTGEHPFSTGRGAKAQEIKERIMSGKLPDHPNWTSLCGQARDFVQRLLIMDPSQRAGASEALQHPWLRPSMQDGAGPAAAGQDCVPRSVFDGLWKYQTSSRLKKAALKLLAKEVDESRIQQLREYFRELDGEQDGYLTRDAILSGMQRHQELQVFKSVDLRSVLPPGASDQISCTSFVAAQLAQQGFSRAELLYAFRRFDIHNEGKLSAKTLAEVLKLPVNADQSNTDCDVDFEEFCALINS